MLLKMLVELIGIEIMIQVDKGIKGKEASRFREEDFECDVLAKMAVFSLLHKLGAKNLIAEAGSEIDLPYHRDIECDLDGKHLIISAEIKHNWMFGNGYFPFDTVNVLNRKSKEANSRNKFTTFALCSEDLKGIAIIKYEVYDPLNPVLENTRRGPDYVRKVPISNAKFYRLVDYRKNTWEILGEGREWQTLS